MQILNSNILLNNDVLKSEEDNNKLDLIYAT